MIAIDVNLDSECPNNLCADSAYYSIITKYLINSVYSQDVFENVLNQIPTYSSFILGKTLFLSLNTLTESYRKYKNYVFLSNLAGNSNSSANYNWLMSQYEKSFNDNLYELTSIINTRLAIFESLEQKVQQVTIVTDLEDPTIVYTSNPDITKRLNYISELLATNLNIFNNLVLSYKANFPSELIGQ